MQREREFESKIDVKYVPKRKSMRKTKTTMKQVNV